MFKYIVVIACFVRNIPLKFLLLNLFNWFHVLQFLIKLFLKKTTRKNFLLRGDGSRYMILLFPVKVNSLRKCKQFCKWFPMFSQLMFTKEKWLDFLYLSRKICDKWSWFRSQFHWIHRSLHGSKQKSNTTPTGVVSKWNINALDWNQD